MAENIIIDGCDVSGCEWIREVGLDSEYICTCNSPNKTSGYCKYNSNCCNKELKRKEQECEELKKQLIKCDDNIIADCEYSKKDLCSFIHRKKEVITGLQQQLDQLKAENEELKKVSCKFKDYCTCDTEKLKQTLTEIKTIALRPICVIRIAEREEFGDAEWSELRGKTIIARQILQIISEYEEKENE